jgi:hypothetical protein
LLYPVKKGIFFMEGQKIRRGFFEKNIKESGEYADNGVL